MSAEMYRTAFLLLLAVLSVEAITTVQLFRNGNTTSHCSATRLPGNVLLTLADCLHNSTTKRPYQMLKADSQMITQTNVLPSWKNTTNPSHNFGIAFISGKAAPGTDIIWSAYALEEESCITVKSSRECPPNKNDDSGTLSLGTGTLVDLGIKTGVSAGEPVLIESVGIFSLVLPKEKCNNGWKNAKDSCGLRITKMAFDFICSATKNSLPSCNNVTMKLGTDEEPILMTSKTEYDGLSSLPLSMGVILIYCDDTLAGSKTDCSLCSSRRLQQQNSLDRSRGLRKKDYIVRRIDLDILRAQVSSVPTIIVRLRNNRKWYEYRGQLSKLITLITKDTLKTDDEGLTVLNGVPALSSGSRVKRQENRGNINCGYCGGFSQVLECPELFLNGLTPNISGGLQPICVKNADNPNMAVYAVYYNCGQRIAHYAATKLNAGSLSTGRLKKSKVKSYDRNIIHPQHQASASDYIGSSRVHIHQGHLIADRFFSSEGEKQATYYFINIVPQLSSLNNGPWKSYEGKLIKWVSNNCRMKMAYTIVGVIPSENYFGKGGISNEQNDYFRLNKPKYIYTAACCEWDNRPGTWKATFYYAENNDKKVYITHPNHDNMMPSLGDLFPREQQCAQNFVNINEF